MTAHITLKEKAEELSRAMHAVAQALAGYDGPQRDYTAVLGKKLMRGLAAYDRAVFETRVRSEAADALAALTPLMTEASAARTKGEIPFGADTALTRYYDLHTCFRELEHKGEG